MALGGEAGHEPPLAGARAGRGLPSPGPRGQRGHDFAPIAGSAYGMEHDAGVDRAPWLIPRGYVQSVVADENSLDVYAWSDWTDVNTVNDSGPQAGR